MKKIEPVSINNLTFDALISKVAEYPADVPAYPVEAGFMVSDGIIRKQLVLELTLFVTDSPVSFVALHGNDPGRVENVLDELRRLYFDEQPVRVITNDGIYENMAIAGFTDPKDGSYGAARAIDISLRQITITERQTATIPAHYGRGGNTAYTGTANTTRQTITDPAPRPTVAHMLGSMVNLW